MVLVDYETSYDYQVSVFVNNKQVLASNLPDKSCGTWTDILEEPDSMVVRPNVIVRRGSNRVSVTYRIMKRKPEDTKLGPKTFHITVRIQKDPANPKTAFQVAEIKGPEIPGAINSTGVKSATFTLK
jgi:hypothetical protein